MLSDFVAPAVTAGLVLSTLTVEDALPVLPATSLQVALSGRLPSPDETLLVVQLAVSIPEPPALSAQFQVTVTSLLFQPAPLAAGDRAGLAVGAMASSAPYNSALARGVKMPAIPYPPATKTFSFASSVAV